MDKRIVNLNGNFKFRGENLKKARQLSAMTISSLSSLVGISTQSISKYENDKAIPSIDSLTKLSKTLKVPINFFYSRMFDEEPKHSIGFFRKYSKVSKRDMEKAEMYATLTWVIYSKLSKHVNFPKYADPVSVIRTSEFKPIDRDLISDTAESIRKKYKLGEGPLLNLTGFMESLGICINYVDLDDLRIDAYTTFFGQTPVILINSNRVSSSRIRFNLAHELAHILFHAGYLKDYQVGDEHNIIEEEANYFAGCFLVPENGLVSDLESINLEYFFSLKSHYHVSAAALITRSEQLGLISATHSLHLRQQMSRKGYRKQEPLDDSIPKEEALLLKTGFNIVNKSNKSVQEVFPMIPIGDYFFDKIMKNKVLSSIDKTQLRVL